MISNSSEIGVVVLNYNNYQLTIHCVDLLIKLDTTLDIVIVDNHSNNSSYEELAKYYAYSKIKIIETNENKGYAFGNNVGLKELINNNNNIKYLCVINPDVEIIDKNIFVSLSNILKNYNNVAIVTGLMQIRDKVRLENCFWNLPKGKEIATQAFVKFKRKNPEIIKDENDVMKVDVVPGSFFMIKKSVYEKIGGLDEGTFLYEEENLLSWKVKQIGMTEAVSFKDTYLHNHIKQNKNLITKLKKKTIGFNSRRYLAKKYYSFADQILLEAVIVINYVVIVLQYMHKLLCDKEN